MLCGICDYVMCYVKDVMCCEQYDTYDDASYSHGMTFRNKFGKSLDFPY